MSEAAVDVGRLLERIDDLEARVAELEAQLDGEDTSASASPDRFGDHRDQAVLDCFQSGGEASLATLRKLYRKQTDISNGRTIKRRIKALTQDGPFESVGQSRWRYTGGERDE